MIAESEIRFRVLAMLYLILVLCCAAYACGRRPWDTRGAVAAPSATPYPEAVVNGELISQDELVAALNAHGGSAELQRLMEQHLILQEADKEKINLNDPASMLALEAVSKSTSDAVSYRALEEETRARLLLRKMLLKEVSDEVKDQTWKRFQADLVQYEVYTAGVEARRDVRSEACKVGFLTRAGIASYWGQSVADAVVRLRPGRQATTPPLATTQGMAVFAVGRVLTSYEDLKTSVEDILVAQTEGAYMYHLTRAAVVSYPLADALAGIRSAVPAAPAGQETPVFAPPPAPVAGQKPEVFASPPPMPAGQERVIFAPPPQAIPGRRSPIFAPPPGIPVQETPGVFVSPPPAEHDKTGVFAPLPKALRHDGDGVFAKPLPSAVK
ncbi:MAG TPA: hypothetical protein VGO93_27235 [Candidatus Xenobia bacterium]